MGWQVQRREKSWACSKLPQQFGFSIEYTDNNANLRYYFPDFVVKTDTGEMWLIETKGQESLEVAYKDRAAQMWCENSTILTGQQWRYVKVPKKKNIISSNLWSSMISLLLPTKAGDKDL